MMVDHVCPVGALTTTDFRFKARVWFLRTAASVCQGCATGCNAHLDYDPRFNKAYRYRPRDNADVNKFWMCDDGMLSYKRAHDGRVTEPAVQGGRTVSTAERVRGGEEAARRSAFGVARGRLQRAALARGQLGAPRARQGSSGRPGLLVGLAEGYADDILMNKDKNPNTLGVKKLKEDAQPFAKLAADAAGGAVTHAIALGGATPGDATSDADALRALKLVTIAAHDGALVRARRRGAPRGSWAEASGSYVNAKGTRQLSEKALEPLGSSRPAWFQLAQLARPRAQPTWGKVDRRPDDSRRGPRSPRPAHLPARRHPSHPAPRRPSDEPRPSRLGRS